MNKSQALLRGSAARRRISEPMSDHSAGCNPCRHIRHRKSTIKIGQRVTPDLYNIHNTATDRRCARSHSNTPPVKKLAPLTTKSSSLRCVSVAEHHTAEQCSKTGSTKPVKHLPRNSLSWNTCQDFLAQDTKPLRSCSGNRAKMLLKSLLGIKCHSQYNKVIRLLQHSSANAGDWGCIVRYLATIIVLVLVLLTFNFFHERSHHY